jgi:hypothetical protein
MHEKSRPYGATFSAGSSLWQRSRLHTTLDLPRISRDSCLGSFCSFPGLGLTIQKIARIIGHLLFGFASVPPIVDVVRCRGFHTHGSGEGRK